MRPIGYGLISFFGGGALWVLFSVVAGLELGFTGTSEFHPLVLVFFLVFVFSMPVALVAEVVQWRKRRRGGA